MARMPASSTILQTQIGSLLNAPRDLIRRVDTFNIGLMARDLVPHPNSQIMNDNATTAYSVLQSKVMELARMTGLTETPSILFQQKPWKISPTSDEEIQMIADLFDSDAYDDKNPSYLGCASQMAFTGADVFALECTIGRDRENRENDLELVLTSAMMSYASPDNFSRIFGLNKSGHLASILRISREPTVEHISNSSNVVNELYLRGELTLLPEDGSEVQQLRSFHLMLFDYGDGDLCFECIEHSFLNGAGAMHNSISYDDPVDSNTKRRLKNIGYSGLEAIHDRVIPALRQHISG